MQFQTPSKSQPQSIRWLLTFTTILLSASTSCSRKDPSSKTSADFVIGEDCDRNIDCGYGEHCGAMNKCVAGCVNAVYSCQSGKYCDMTVTPALCRDGCTEQTFCEKGKVCDIIETGNMIGMCVNGCYGDDDCELGKVCDAVTGKGNCVDGCRSCGVLHDCNHDGVCDGDNTKSPRGCAQGFVCTTTSTCVMGNCNKWGDCHDGKVCVNYNCIDPTTFDTMGGARACPLGSYQDNNNVCQAECNNDTTCTLGNGECAMPASWQWCNRMTHMCQGNPYWGHKENDNGYAPDQAGCWVKYDYGDSMCMNAVQTRRFDNCIIDGVLEEHWGGGTMCSTSASFGSDPMIVCNTWCLAEKGKGGTCKKVPMFDCFGEMGESGLCDCNGGPDAGVSDASDVLDADVTDTGTIAADAETIATDAETIAADTGTIAADTGTIAADAGGT